MHTPKIIKIIYNKNHLKNKINLNFFYNNSSKSSMLQPLLIKAPDMIKIYVISNLTWSSGMLTQLLDLTNERLARTILNVKNARKEWVTWEFTKITWLTYTNIYTTLQLMPWSIRIRRLFKGITANSMFITIRYNNNKFFTPKRRIKRWLKKKYTTQSWR